ncbi:MAG: hypothetical protein V3V30_05875 [Parvularculaceae bacterium]
MNLLNKINLPQVIGALALACAFPGCSQSAELAPAEPVQKAMPEEDNKNQEKETDEEETTSDLIEHQTGDGEVTKATSSDDEEDQDSEPVADPE